MRRLGSHTHYRWIVKNASEVQPNIVHSDTQVSRYPYLPLLTLLGIQLMPRIRNWKDLNLYRVDKKVRYINIDSMFVRQKLTGIFGNTLAGLDAGHHLRKVRKSIFFIYTVQIKLI